MTGYFIYGDVDTRNYEGIVVSEDEVDSAPERAYEEITIAGRNGTLLLDGNRYENVIHSYDITVYDDYVDNLIKLRNDILSKVGYQVLRDSFNPDEKYLARVYTQVIPKQKTQRDAGNMHIEFSRKPQRFLVDGDRAISPTDWSGVQTESGELVTIDSDGSLAVRSLEVSLSPIQDLNDYDKPWVGGAGKNKLHVTATTQTINGVTFTVNSDGTITANGTATANTGFQLYAGTNNTFDLANGNYILTGCPTGDGSNTYRIWVDDRNSAGTGNITSVADAGAGANITITQGKCRAYLFIVSGQTVSNLVFYPMLRLASETDATFEPYENICPISGRTEVVTHRTGKNLLPYPYNEVTHTSNGVTFTVNDDGSVTANGTATAIAYFHFVTRSVTGSLGFLKTGNYIASPAPQGASSTTFRYQVRANGTWVDVYTTQKEFSYVNGGGGLDAYSIRIESGATVNNVTFYPMLRLASETDATYEPYNSNTYTTALGRTVYGGMLDVVSGELTVTHGFTIFNGDEEWSLSGSGTSCNYRALASVIKHPRNDEIADILCNRFDAKTDDQVSASTIGISVYSSGYIRVCVDGQATTVSAFKTWLSSNNLQVVYELATPQTYQLTPQQIDLLLGTNHLWSDGEITVEYGVHPYYNPTPFDAKPLIKVTGRGTLGIGEYILTITGAATQTLYIDCETMEIYTIEGTVPMGASSLVSINKNDFPVLEPGTNYISVGSGITAVTITPRWWRI